MIKVELEFESKNGNIGSVFHSLTDILSKAEEKGLNLKELEIESEDKENQNILEK